MGLAASQARYLLLTNMLNDVEFEGQQINTARSNLSSTSAKYYNQLLNMDVPTPPVKTDYTTLTYKFSKGAKDYTITHIGNMDADGNAKISTQYTGYGATIQPSVAAGSNEANVHVTHEKVKVKEKDPVTGEEKDVEKVIYKINGKEAVGLDSLDEDNRKSLETAIKQSGANPDDYYVTEQNGQYKLVPKADVHDTDNNGKGVQTYEVHDSNKAIFEETMNVKLEFGTDGRISKIYDGTLALLVEPILTVDELAYEDAFAQYTYNKAIYDKDQATINAQLSTIQQQDKRLELQLTELDTRRKEITTELESVKTVMTDDIESSFKSFG